MYSYVIVFSLQRIFYQLEKNSINSSLVLLLSFLHSFICLCLSLIEHFTGVWENSDQTSNKNIDNNDDVGNNNNDNNNNDNNNNDNDNNKKKNNNLGPGFGFALQSSQVGDLNTVSHKDSYSFDAYLPKFCFRSLVNTVAEAKWIAGRPKRVTRN